MMFRHAFSLIALRLGIRYELYELFISASRLAFHQGQFALFS